MVVFLFSAGFAKDFGKGLAISMHKNSEVTFGFLGSHTDKFHV